MSVAGNKKRVFITLDLNILEQLEFLAEKKGVNKSSLISFWISDEYERVKNSEKKTKKINNLYYSYYDCDRIMAKKKNKIKKNTLFVQLGILNTIISSNIETKC